MTPFDPLNLTPPASLNRVRVVDVPGVDLPDGIRGKTGYGLLSKDTLIAELVTHATALELDANNPARLPFQFGRCFASNDADILTTAHAIARRWGERLATLVLILKRGDVVQRLARPEWDTSYWEHWGSVEHIWCGGGLVAGAFGRELVQEAQAFLGRVNHHGTNLYRPSHPQILPLIGAARSVPTNHDAAIVLDFGGTEVKRAIPRFDEQHLTRLQLLPSLPVTLGDTIVSTGSITRQFIADAISATIDASTSTGSNVHVEASISAYAASNRLLSGQGGRYIAMDEDGVGGAYLIARLAEQQTGTRVTLRFIHDGTAAARVFAGAPRTSLIMLGTALGSGHAPPAAAYRPIAADFALETT